MKLTIKHTRDSPVTFATRKSSAVLLRKLCLFFSGRWITVFFFSVIFRSSSPARPEDSPDAEVHEKYIELMCKYQPDLVHSYLRNTENYRLEETLAVCSSCYRLGLHQRRFFRVMFLDLLHSRYLDSQAFAYIR